MYKDICKQENKTHQMESLCKKKIKVSHESHKISFYVKLVFHYL